MQHFLKKSSLGNCLIFPGNLTSLTKSLEYVFFIFEMRTVPSSLITPMESRFSQTGRMHYPNFFLLCNHKILNKKSTLQKFVIWFIHSFVSHYLLSASSFVRLLGERHEHNQSEFVKKLYSDYWPKIFLLSSPKLCLTSLLLSKQITSDSKKTLGLLFQFYILLYFVFKCAVLLFYLNTNVLADLKMYVTLGNLPQHHPFTGNSFSFTVDTGTFLSAKENERRRENMFLNFFFSASIISS